jgi:thioredoxin-dependent peroxiredoxin
MKVGDQAPGFELQDETGTPRRLADLLAGGPVVLYFYPMAMTRGCTAESCHFRDLGSEFKDLGAQRVGVSADKVDKQKRFADKNRFDFPLLSDPDRAVARAYGVNRTLGFLPNKRATFVIGADGVIKEIITSEVNMAVHADKSLSVLRSLEPPAQPAN